jgi:hypothetical protein
VIDLSISISEAPSPAADTSSSPRGRGFEVRAEFS